MKNMGEVAYFVAVQCDMTGSLAQVETSEHQYVMHWLKLEKQQDGFSNYMNFLDHSKSYYTVPCSQVI